MVLTFSDTDVILVMSTKQRKTMKPSPGVIQVVVKNNTTRLFQCVFQMGMFCFDYFLFLPLTTFPVG